MKILSCDAVVAAIREAAHDEYVLSDKVGRISPGLAACTPTINQIVRFFAERVIDKIEALDCGIDTTPERCREEDVPPKRTGRGVFREAGPRYVNLDAPPAVREWYATHGKEIRDRAIREALLTEFTEPLTGLPTLAMKEGAEKDYTVTFGYMEPGKPPKPRSWWRAWCDIFRAFGRSDE